MVDIVVWSDISCPWAHRTVHGLHEARDRLGLGEAVHFDHRAFPLELFNRRCTPKPIFDEEILEVGALAPDAGWQAWEAPEWQWSVTTLPALEAVQAAKEQGLPASEQLDRALRRAHFAKSRCVSMRHVILDVADTCAGVDVNRLARALDDGRARRTVIDHYESAQASGVKGSPHVFLPDGTNAHNPSDYGDLVRRAAGLS